MVTAIIAVTISAVLLEITLVVGIAKLYGAFAALTTQVSNLATATTALATEVKENRERTQEHAVAIARLEAKALDGE